jgi:hypothetical protein
MSITTINIQDLANLALEVGMGSLPNIGNISTSGIDDPNVAFGDTKKIPVYAGTAITDYNESSNNYETENGTLAEVECVFNKRKKATVGIADIAKKRFNMEEWIKVQTPMLCRGVIKDILSLVTVANYGAAPTGLIGLANSAAFGLNEVGIAKSVGDLAETWNDQRSLWLVNDWYNKFAGTFASYITGGQIMLDGVLGNKLGIAMEAFVIPDNTEKLVGFICDKSAIALGFLSTPVSEQGSALVDLAVATDPSGVTFMVGLHYNTATRKTFCTLETVYGRAKGTDHLARITKA